MLKRTSLGTLGLVSFASALHAGVQVQTIPFDYNPNEGTISPVIQAFDSLGGTRQLTSINFGVTHNFALDLIIESTGPTAISVGDTYFSFEFYNVLQIGEATKENPSPPFIGTGAFFVGDISADLAAYDGIPGNNGPDSTTLTLTDAFNASFTYLPEEDPSLFLALTDTGAITSVFGGFTSYFFTWINDPAWPQPPEGAPPEYPNDAALWYDWNNFRHQGELVVTYEYADVPAPMSVLPFAGLLAIGRRRR